MATNKDTEVMAVSEAGDTSTNNVSNVTTGRPKIKGAVYVAPVGTVLPTTADGALNKAFKGLGYISDAGIVNSNSPSTDTVKAWGGDTVLVTESERPDTFKMSFLESLNVDVLKVVYGEENVSGTLEAGLTIKANSDEGSDWSYVVDMILRGGILKRIVLPQARLSELGDITYMDSDPVAYEATLTCQPDGEGQTHYEYLKKKTVSA